MGLSHCSPSELSLLDKRLVVAVISEIARMEIRSGKGQAWKPMDNSLWNWVDYMFK